jgi:hypothetical protein
MSLNAQPRALLLAITDLMIILADASATSVGTSSSGASAQPAAHKPQAKHKKGRKGKGKVPSEGQYAGEASDPTAGGVAEDVESTVQKHDGRGLISAILAAWATAAELGREAQIDWLLGKQLGQKRFST